MNSENAFISKRFDPKSFGDVASHRILLFPKEVIPNEQKASLLRRKSLEVRAASNASQALSFSRKWRPQQIVFSSQLPDTTAVKFCETIKSYPELDHTKLMMLTDQLGGNMDDEFVQGVDAHLVNPVDSAQLFQTMASLLDIGLRSAKRVDVDLIGHVDLLDKNVDDDVKTAVNILNLCESGLLIESPVPMSVGSVVRVRFFLPGTSDQLSLFCTVRLLANELILHYGVEFVGLKSEEKEKLRSFVQAESDK